MIDPTRLCSECQAPLKSYQGKFCGHRCRGVARARENAAKADPRDCAVCGTTIDVSKPANRTRVTCSTACDRIRRRHVALANVASGKGPPRNVMTEAQRQAARERITGPNAPWWKGGKNAPGHYGDYVMLHPQDYPYPQSLDAQGYILEHRAVMETHLGRALTRREVVHHENENSRDNRIENLRLFASQADHMRHHRARR